MAILAQYFVTNANSPSTIGQIKMPGLYVAGDTIRAQTAPNQSNADSYEIVTEPALLRPNTPGLDRVLKCRIDRDVFSTRSEISWEVFMSPTDNDQLLPPPGNVRRMFSMSIYLPLGNEAPGVLEWRGPGRTSSGNEHSYAFMQHGRLNHQISPDPGCKKVTGPPGAFHFNQSGTNDDIDIQVEFKRDHHPGGECGPADEVFKENVWGPNSPIGFNVLDLRGEWIDFVWETLWEHEQGYFRVWMSSPSATNNAMVQLLDSDNFGSGSGWGYRDTSRGPSNKFFTQYWKSGSGLASNGGNEAVFFWPPGGQANRVTQMDSYHCYGQIGDHNSTLAEMTPPIGTEGGGETAGTTVAIISGAAPAGTLGTVVNINTGASEGDDPTNEDATTVRGGIVRVFTSSAADVPVRTCVFPELANYTASANNAAILVVMTNDNAPGFVCGVGLSDGDEHRSVVGISQNGVAAPVTKRTLSSDQSLIHVPSDANFADIKFPAFAGFFEGGCQWDWTGQETTQGNVKNHYWMFTGPNVIVKLVTLQGVPQNQTITTPQLWTEPVAPNLFIGFMSGTELAVPGANLTNNLQFSLGFAAHDGTQIDQGQYHYSIENGVGDHVGRMDQGIFLTRINTNNGRPRAPLALESVANGQATFRQVLNTPNGSGVDDEYYVLCIYTGGPQAKVGTSQLPLDTSDLEIGVGPAQSQLSIATHLTTLLSGDDVVATEDPSVGAFCISMASIDAIDTSGSVQLSAAFREEYLAVGNTNNETRTTNALAMEVPDHLGAQDYTSDLVNNKSDGSGVRFSTVTGSATAGHVLWMTIGKNPCSIASYTPETVKSGDSIVVRGLGFLPDPQAFLDATPINTTILTGDTEIQVDIPPDSEGTHQLTVQTSAGTSLPVTLHVTGGKTYFFRGAA